ncbi:HTH-type transcriptional regulator SgrR [Propionicimonas sp. T2.31MG-18]|uniref:ABC transporter substrate-binding protein n=1 Tax=Propionicimonas sp. T2.31MG-18 TaxID=3157620 RepID=UPI0035EB5EA6
MFPIRDRKPARLGLAAVVVGVSAALAVTGCAGAGSGGSSGPVLTIAASAPPTSLDPMLQSVDQINNMYINVAYDSLTRIDKDGKIAPDLATEWKYTDKTNTTFELKVRGGVKFSDGSALTAQDVADSLNYARTKGVNGPNWMGAIDSVTAQDDTTVVIKNKTPNDALPYLLSQRLLVGSVVSSEAASDPAKLKTATFGAGPYMLDPAQTVANATYTYVPNKNYWDQSKIKYTKIVIKVVADANAALQAVQSGSADLFSGNQPTATAAKAAGLTVATAPFGISGILISDRSGTTVPALKDPKVRQAMMYAIDRSAISKAVFGGFSDPSPSLILKGQDGYTGADDSIFTYDMAKAKQLLTEAGYAGGFSFDMSTPAANNTNLMAQAVVQSWAQLGIKANLQTYTDLGQLTTDVLAKKYPVSAFNYGSLPTYIQSRSFFNGGATQYNAWNYQDADINKSLETAAAASDQAKTDAYFAAWHRAQADQALLSAVYIRQQVTIYDQKKITGVYITTQNPVVDLGWTVAPVK